MSYLISATPGAPVTIFFETKDGYVRADGYPAPTVTRIFFPNLSLAAGYPKPMVKVDTGLYMFTFTIPMGSTAVGSYLVDISWTDPATLDTGQTFFQVIVSAPFGQYSITAG